MIFIVTTTIKKDGKTFTVERRSPSEGGTRLVEQKPKTSSEPKTSSKKSSTTTITSGGRKTTVVRRPASEGGTFSFETSSSATGDKLPTSIKGGSNNPVKRQETLLNQQIKAIEQARTQAQQQAIKKEVSLIKNC